MYSRDNSFNIVILFKDFVKTRMVSAKILFSNDKLIIKFEKLKTQNTQFFFKF